MADSALGLVFEISADPSKAVTAVNTFSDQTVAALQRLEAQVITTTNVGSDKAKFFAASMNDFSETTKGVSTEFGRSMNEMESGMTALESVIAGLGPLMGIAFSAVVVYHMIELVGTQLPAAYHALIDALSGWDEAAKKSYDTFIKQNEEAEARVRKLALQLANIGKTPVEQAANNLEDARKKVAELGEEFKGARTKAEGLREEMNRRIAAGASSPKIDFGRIPEDLDLANKNADDLWHKLEKATAAWQELSDAQKLTNAKEENKQATKDADDAAKAALAKERIEEQSAAKKLQIEKAYREALAANYRTDVERALAAVTKENADFEKAQKDKAAIEHSFKLATDEVYRDQVVRALKRVEDENRAITAAQKKTMDLAVITAREGAHMIAQVDKAKTDAEIAEEKRRLQAIEDSYRKQIRIVQQAGNVTMGLLSEISGIARNNHAVEVAMIIARGAIKAAEQVAEGLAAAAYGNFWAAGMHYASAAAFAGLAGYSASVSAPAGSGSGSASSLSTSAPERSGPVSMAPGSAGGRAMGGTVHMIISSSDRELANHIGDILTKNVRHGGGQLVASKVMER